MIADEDSKSMNLVRNLYLVSLGLFLLFILISNDIIRKEKKLAQDIYPSVYIDEMRVGEKTKRQARLLFDKKNRELAKASLTISYKNTKTVFNGKDLRLRLNQDEIIDRAFIIGRTPHFPSRVYQKMAAIYGFDSFKFYTEVVYDKEHINEFIEQLDEKYNKPAKNALFKFENGRVVSFRPEQKGIKIKTDELVKDIESNLAALKNKTENKRVLVKDLVIEPEITLAKTNQLGIEELIGEGRSNFTGSIPNRVHNITISASRFNGVLIPKDAMISFNEIVGDISFLTGYKEAYIIKNGRTVLGDGGGVCQVSTTLFRAALNSGLPIEERVAHAYRVGYYENDSQPGFDATVYAPSVDLKIKNNTSANILIQTEIDTATNQLVFRFYGKKDNRQVEISPVILTNVSPPPPPLHQDDPSLKKGVVSQVDFAAYGGRSSFNYRVTKQGSVIFEKNFISSYRPWQAVYLVGTAD